MLKYLIEKEFKQIVRNSFLPRLIIVMPLMIMLVLPWAADQEIKNVKLSVIDNDHSPDSERLIRKIVSSGYFVLVDVSDTNEQAMQRIESGDADVILDEGWFGKLLPVVDTRRLFRRIENRIHRRIECDGRLCSRFWRYTSI